MVLKGIDLTRFSCIAADQYTQDLAYWKRIKYFIGGAPSAYNLIYPEAEYIARPNNLQKRISSISNTMNEYISNSTYEDIGPCFIFVERTSSSQHRRGLLVAIDLEQYDYNEGAKTLIRATEKTVKDRLTIRRMIREEACLDLPHVLVLINDKDDKLFKRIESIKSESPLSTLYDFDLMENSGHIKGYKISNEKDIESLTDILIELKEKSEDNFLYAIGDGNHSLAAAKDVYEKTGRGRYALVELVNTFDGGIKFFPIHRLIIRVNRERFINDTSIDPDNPPPLQELQSRLDKFNYNIDYIHGKKECIELGKKEGNISITYDNFSIDTLFSDVIKYGALCRKSFSLGEAQDKRFYLEAQIIS